MAPIKSPTGRSRRFPKRVDTMTRNVTFKCSNVFNFFQIPALKKQKRKNPTSNSAVRSSLFKFCFLIKVKIQLLPSLSWQSLKICLSNPENNLFRKKVPVSDALDQFIVANTSVTKLALSECFDKDFLKLSKKISYAKNWVTQFLQIARFNVNIDLKK